LFGVSYTTIGLIAAVILFPGVFFGAINVLFLLVTVGPLLLSVAVKLFIKANTLQKPCPGKLKSLSFIVIQ
jgi:hypothetical protein